MKDRNDKPVAKGTTDKKDKAATSTGAVVGGVGGGIAGGAAAGAAVGGMTGPVGAAVGAAAGALVGALTGKGIAKAVDPAAEDKYWKDNYSSRPYVASGTTYDDYGPAYRYGVDTYSQNPDRQFEDLEPELQRNWSSCRGNSKLEWEHARPASHDAWQRVSNAAERAVPGDSDRDGR